MNLSSGHILFNVKNRVPINIFPVCFTNKPNKGVLIDNILNTFDGFVKKSNYDSKIKLALFLSEVLQEKGVRQHNKNSIFNSLVLSCIDNM